MSDDEAQIRLLQSGRRLTPKMAGWIVRPVTSTARDIRRRLLLFGHALSRPSISSWQFRVEQLLWLSVHAPDVSLGPFAKTPFRPDFQSFPDAQWPTYPTLREAWLNAVDRWPDQDHVILNASYVVDGVDPELAANILARCGVRGSVNRDVFMRYTNLAIHIARSAIGARRLFWAKCAVDAIALFRARTLEAEHKTCVALAEAIILTDDCENAVVLLRRIVPILEAENMGAADDAFQLMGVAQLALGDMSGSVTSLERSLKARLACNPYLRSSRNDLFLEMVRRGFLFPAIGYLETVRRALPKTYNSLQLRLGITNTPFTTEGDI